MGIDGYQRLCSLDAGPAGGAAHSPGLRARPGRTSGDVLLMMVGPALPFSIGALVNGDLNPLPVLVWFQRPEWWLLVCPAVFGIAWPLLLALIAWGWGWRCGRGCVVLALALSAIVFNLIAFWCCLRAGAAGLV